MRKREMMMKIWPESMLLWLSNFWFILREQNIPSRNISFIFLTPFFFASFFFNFIGILLSFAQCIQHEILWLGYLLLAKYVNLTSHTDSRWGRPPCLCLAYLSVFQTIFKFISSNFSLFFSYFFLIDQSIFFQMNESEIVYRRSSLFCNMDETL